MAEPWFTVIDSSNDGLPLRKYKPFVDRLFPATQQAQNAHSVRQLTPSGQQPEGHKIALPRAGNANPFSAFLVNGALFPVRAFMVLVMVQPLRSAFRNIGSHR